MNNQFKQLYRDYQALMIKTFKECLEEKGWKITKTWFSSPYSKDIAFMRAEIKGDLPNQVGKVNFNHMWLDFLFIDRDEKPSRVDLNILNQHYANNKLKYIVSIRTELIDADFRDDEEKLHQIGKSIDRLRIGNAGKKPLVHYEWGVDVTKLKRN